MAQSGNDPTIFKYYIKKINQVIYILTTRGWPRRPNWGLEMA